MIRLTGETDNCQITMVLEKTSKTPNQSRRIDPRPAAAAGTAGTETIIKAAVEADMVDSSSRHHHRHQQQHTGTEDTVVAALARATWDRQISVARHGV